jgi:hypothetical protein
MPSSQLPPSLQEQNGRDSSEEERAGTGAGRSCRAGAGSPEAGLGRGVQRSLCGHIEAVQTPEKQQRRALLGALAPSGGPSLLSQNLDALGSYCQKERPQRRGPSSSSGSSQEQQ